MVRRTSKAYRLTPPQGGKGPFPIRTLQQPPAEDLPWLYSVRRRHYPLLFHYFYHTGGAIVTHPQSSLQHGYRGLPGFQNELNRILVFFVQFLLCDLPSRRFLTQVDPSLERVIEQLLLPPVLGEPHDLTIGDTDLPQPDSPCTTSGRLSPPRMCLPIASRTPCRPVHTEHGDARICYAPLSPDRAPGAM